MKFGVLADFFKHYLELPSKETKIVCLGGGVGTAKVLTGLKDYPVSLSAVVSMADDGGSAGRLRRTFDVPPPGDIVNCLAALSKEGTVLKDLLLYRFAGERYGNDNELGGHKLGNLFLVALSYVKKDFNQALAELSQVLAINGKVLPATQGDVNIWAETEDGQKIYGEQNIDLGKYDGKKRLSKVHLTPPNAKAFTETIQEIKGADFIIIGPGDLYTTILPVLIVPAIKKAIEESEAKKIFVINVANKPFETKGYKLSDYCQAFRRNLGFVPFDFILANANTRPKIPKDLKYQYVEIDKEALTFDSPRIFFADLIDEKFPIHHNPQKLAKVLFPMLR